MNPELVGRILHVTSEPDPWGRWPFEANPAGIMVAHTWLQIAALLWGIEEYGIRLFVELGTYKGGLGAILLPGVTYGKYAYLSLENSDVVDPRFRQNVEAFKDPAKAQLLMADVFHPDTIEGVRARIASAPGPALIYCDDGKKPDEMRMYVGLLRIGDYIAAHDYPGEITYEDIHPLIERNGLEEVAVDFWREGIGVPMLRKVGNP